MIIAQNLEDVCEYGSVRKWVSKSRVYTNELIRMLMFRIFYHFEK